MQRNSSYFLLFIVTVCLGMATSCFQAKQEGAINYFQNPVLAGFYPDPSICKADGKYYMVTSSFSYFPGLPIFESDDLVNWTQIGHVMDRPSQLNTQGQGISRGLFAPTITYHQGVFYVTCTHIDRGGNFIVKSKNPAGPWSEPIYLPEVNGIDPSLYFEEDKAFIVYNSIPPGNQSLYDGHRTIRLFQLNFETLQVMGEQSLLVNGGVNLEEKPVWIEAPHIYKINNRYYLMCAEGGTGDNHSEVIFRSDSIRGPYEPWGHNPILTQRHLPPDRDFPVTTAGHADLIQGDDGDWWAVFLACRPYGDNYYNIGRETFMAPVTWTEDQWPVINPEFEEVQYRYPTPGGVEVDIEGFQYTGNFQFKDEFEKGELALHYVFLRTPSEKWYDLTDSQLQLDVRPEIASGLSDPSFIGHRQQHHEGSVETSLRFTATAENEKSGLIFFQNEQHYYFLCKSFYQNNPVVELYQAAESGEVLLARQELSQASNLKLKANFSGEHYAFLYSDFGDDWQVLKDGLDGTYLSTQVAGGFVGTVIGMYATSTGKASTNSASFDYFQYSGNDQVFKKSNNERE